LKLVRAAWRLLVGIKDALVLVALLLFFGLLFAALSARPGGNVGEGALVLDLDGALVEQPSEPAALASLGGQSAPAQVRLRDALRALDAAAGDARVKAVVLDLDGFGGGYQAAVTELADAVARVRRVKPVLAYAGGYSDDGYLLAAAATEVWQDPLGGTLFAGPGGSQPYLKGLIDRLGVNVHVYRVGKFKAAVEPLTRADQSPEAREASAALNGALLSQWREAVRRLRPRAQVDGFLAAPDRAVVAANGDIAGANKAAGLVDRLGDRAAFERRVAEYAGADATKWAGGSYRRIPYDRWLAANPLPTAGEAVGVLTVAGDIVDGEAGPGTAGGETIARAVAKGLAQDNLKALVVRVDSPGGSVPASERIRQAVLGAKRRGLPVVISMGGIAASGGYWVATAGDTVFAEPSTITGSIGIFGIVPTFEGALNKVGVTGDGVRTTPLSGQPDIFRGTSQAFDAVLQSTIENGYRRFVGLVSGARRLSPARVDEIAQGRVWDGGTARQLGLVDRFGTLSDAVAEAARRARLDPAAVRPVFLEKEPGWLATLVQGFGTEEEDAQAGAGASSGAGGDAFARAAARRRALALAALADARMLAAGGSVQARCLQCAGLGPATASPADARLLDLLLARLWGS